MKTLKLELDFLIGPIVKDVFSASKNKLLSLSSDLFLPHLFQSTDVAEPRPLGTPGDRPRAPRGILARCPR